MNKRERLEQDGWGGVEPILFYSPRDPFGCLSNFSKHTVRLPDPWTGNFRTYATGEHRFQALKGTSREDHDYVLKAGHPSEAQKRGGPLGKITFRDDWGNNYGDMCWYVMLELCFAKALQHREVQRTLDATGEALIYEDSPTDDIWGWRYSTSYTGKNLLGRCWMQVRDMFYR